MRVFAVAMFNPLDGEIRQELVDARSADEAMRSYLGLDKNEVVEVYADASNIHISAIEVLRKATTTRGSASGPLHAAIH